MAKISKLSMLPLILLTVCTISQLVQAEKSIYVFGPDQSTVVKTGGFAGVHETYAVTGQFLLTVDSDAGVASFETVDANLADETGLVYGRSLSDIFNMTGLVGTVIDETTIEFDGKTADGTESDVRLNLSFSDGSAHLTGNTTPPPNSADMFFYDVNAVATTKYAGGTGESNNPYHIATAEDLMLLGETPGDYDKHFVLTDNIDLDPNLPDRRVFGRALIAPDINDVERRFQGTSFTGAFDGKGHSISHMTIVGVSNLGLFGRIDSGAKVKNLVLFNIHVDGSGDYVGSLSGISNEATITNCYGTGTIAGYNSVGGLVGANTYGNITMSCSAGTVTGNMEVGGLVGWFAGDRGSKGIISDCYSIASVSGHDYVGGLVGENRLGFGEDSDWGIISRCFSAGPVTGNNTVGGLVGYNQWGIITTSFWDIETSGTDIGVGRAGSNMNDVIGKTTAHMQTADTFLEAGWDFENETENGIEDIWKISEGLDYPHLSWQKYGGGTGEPNDPYQIATAGDLIALGQSPEDYDKHFALTADIDLDPNLPFDRAIIAPDTNDAERWFQGVPFTGMFDGNNHTISHLTIIGDTCLGLFGQLESMAEIRNLGLINPSVDAVDGSMVGSLAGYMENGTVSHCYAKGSSVVGRIYVGGLVGNSVGGTITSCFVEDSNTVGYRWVGGLVGQSLDSTITNCYSTGFVSDNEYILSGTAGTGGLVGENGGSTITKCYSSAVVDGYKDIGGLVGSVKWMGSVENCYSTGNVTGVFYVGGLVGSYRQWDLRKVSHCYSTGKVTAFGIVSHNGPGYGGLIGYSEGGGGLAANVSFWDTETSEQTTSAGGSGRTTAAMQTASTFIKAIGGGWDFVDEAENGSDDVWKIAEGLDYPRLWWEKYGGGTGEPNNPYLIYTTEHLNTLGDEPNDYDKHFKLMTDIDLGDYAPDKFNFIGEFIPFTGVFDGNGHSISNFHYTDGDRSPLSGGLFSMVADPNAQIRNLTLIDPNISGKVHVGPLVGWMQEGAITNCHVIGGCVNEVFPAMVTDDIGGLVGLVDRGTITGCTSSCRVNGHNSVGGLIGYAGKTDRGGCFITNCRATGDVTGESLVGGLVGIGPHSIIICSCATGQVVGGWQIGGLAGSSGGGVTGRYITDCYATGSVAGRHAVGGLIGTHGHILITRCYAAGQVINLSDEPDTSQHYIGGLIGSEDHADSTCFWDIETSGRTTSKGGIGLTTDEMQTAATFLEAGWDFVGETDNGTEDIWWILEGQDYPRLSWEAHD